MGTAAMQYHIRRPGVSSFKPWGSNLSQFFRIQFKGVRLELLAPICKRGKNKDQDHFSTGGIPPCSRWGCRQTLHQSFPSLVRFSLSLTDTGAMLVLLSSTTKAGWRCTRGRLEKPAFLYLFVSCPPFHLLLQWSESLLKPE